MEILEAFYRRTLKKKQKRSAMFHSELELNRASSLASVGVAGGDASVTGGGTMATGLITRVLHLTRRREPRPHSWHSIKLGEGPSEFVEREDCMTSVRSSSADLLSDLDSERGVRWSLESLEPPAAARLGPRGASSCLQLSSNRSSNVDLRHCKGDTVHSSNSKSLSFPERRGLSGERSFSLEMFPQTQDVMSAHGLSREQEGRARVRLREKTVGGVCYHGSREDSPVWGSSCESLKGAPALQRRSESYTSTRSERPSSWSTLDHARSLRSLRSQQRGSWHHSSSSLASAGPAKGLYMTDGQLHTVIEKSPENSPTSRPRQAQSPTGPQESQCPGLYPPWLRDNQNGHQHRVVPNTYLGSALCHSAVDPQAPPTHRDPAPVSPVSLPHLSQPEHPLTRLEMALAEVQGSSSGLSETSSAPGVSVLEKVSRLEHREWATRQHGLSSRHWSSPKQVSDRSSKTLGGTEDLRNTSERSHSGTKACRTFSHTGVSHEKSRIYRDGAKDTQPKIFRSTSFRCTNSAPQSPPPVPPKVLSYQDKGDSKQLPSNEKKGPKTLPKPHGVVFTSRPILHTFTSPAPHSQASSTLTRICGRKRLTSEQKKRSFSEPESMNEIGLTSNESTAFLRPAGDPSVADRRRMFEMAAQGVVGGACAAGVTLEQEVPLEHVEKNCSQTREGRSQRSIQRPFSAVFQPLQTHADPVKLASSSSLLSLSDCAQEPHLFSGKEPLSSALTSGGNLHSTVSSVLYPGRVTSPRPPAYTAARHESSVSVGEDTDQSGSESRNLSVSQELSIPTQTSSSDDLLRKTNSTPISTPAGAAMDQRVSPGVTVEEESFTVAANRDGFETSALDSPTHLSSKPASEVPPVSVPRRERSRRSARSTLAASVGLPCPLTHTTPPGHKQSERNDTEHGEGGGSAPNLQEPTKQTPDKDHTLQGADSEQVVSTSSPALKTAALAPVLVEDSLVLEYEPVPERIQNPEERKVQALIRTLVRSDRSLLPLMDMWGKSTIDVLKEIFPNSRLLEQLPRRHSDPPDDWNHNVAETSEPSEDLITKKVELCEALRKCTESLQREKEAQSDAFRAHTELGNRVDAWVREHCEDSERNKYHMFIGDLERVVNLLLSLCGRLARLERSLSSLRKQEPEEGSTELWDSLLHKRTLLLCQTQEALELRDHLERRQCTVHAFLRRSLSVAQLQQYVRLVRSTPALLIGLRRLDDLVRQAQEALSRLLDTVPLEVTQARGWSRVGLALTATPLLLMRTQATPTWHSGHAHLDCPVTVTSL